MDARISTQDSNVQIDLTDLNGEEEKFVQAFRQCIEEQCGCPIQEYQRMQSLRVRDGNGAVHVAIMPRDGQLIEPADIQQCIDHTHKRVSDNC